jgi:uncharacterized coiled-coil protein SlyX
MSDFKKYDPYAINAIRLVDSRDLTTLHNRIAELESDLRTRTLMWEGLRDMLGEANDTIAALQEQVDAAAKCPWAKMHSAPTQEPSHE